MERIYFFSDDGQIHVDPEITVAELIRQAYARFHYTEPGGMGQVTVYDAERQVLVTDPAQSCLAAGLSPHLAFAYLVPGEFCYIPEVTEERQRSLAPELGDGVWFRLSCPGFEGSPLVNGCWTLRQLLHFLRQNGWVPENAQGITVMENYYRELDPARREQMRLTAQILEEAGAGDKTLAALGLQGKLCRL